MNSTTESIQTTARFPPASGWPVAGVSMGAQRMAPKITKDHVNFGAWNVRTLLQPGAETFLAMSLHRYDVDIACLSEVRLPDTGTTKLFMPDVLQDHSSVHAYTLFHSGPTDRSGQHGVGFALRKHLAGAVMDFLPISPRLAYIRINAKPLNISIISAYAPTDCHKEGDALKDSFYGDLLDCYRRIPSRDVVFVCGDFNAQIGEVAGDEKKNVGKYTIGRRTDNGDRLLSFAMHNDLVIANTLFHRRLHQLGTWKSNNRPRVRNQIDYIVVPRRWRSSILDSRTHWNELCLESDHALLTMRFRLRLSSNFRKSPINRFDILKLKEPETTTAFAHCVSNNLCNLDTFKCNYSIDKLWAVIQSALLNSAKTVLGRPDRRQKHWISPATLDQIRVRNEAVAKGESSPTIRRLRQLVKIGVRSDKENYWINPAIELERAARCGDSGKVFRLLKPDNGAGVSDVLRKPGGTIISSQDKTCRRMEGLFLWPP